MPDQIWLLKILQVEREPERGGCSGHLQWWCDNGSPFFGSPFIGSPFIGSHLFGSPFIGSPFLNFTFSSPF